MQKHPVGLIFSASLLLLILTACTEPEASADEQAEAASDDWVEAQLDVLDEDVTNAEGRVASLSQDIELLAEGRSFTDVNEESFGFEEIEFLSSRGIIRGHSDGTFRPGNSITRANTAAMLVRELDIDAPDDYELQATDVSTASVHYNNLRKVEYHGIMTGNQGLMNPGDNLTRSQMARVLVRAFEDDIPAAETNHSFTDIDENFSGYTEINRIADAGITTTADTAFRPNENTTRAQFSIFMTRTLDDSYR